MVEHVKARLSVTFAVLGVVCALVSLSYAVVRGADNTRQINAERARNVRSACEETNARNKAVTLVIGQLVKRPVEPRHLTPDQQKRQAEATAKFVQALVPKRDCDALVDRQVTQ